VMIAPDDAELIQGGSEVRRKWMDAVISQYDRAYLDALIDVNKSLPKHGGRSPTSSCPDFWPPTRRSPGAWSRWGSN
jgi:hypothetical protein